MQGHAYTGKDGHQRVALRHSAKSKKSEAAVRYAAGRTLENDAPLHATVATYYGNPVSVTIHVRFEAPAWVRKRHKAVVRGPHKRPPVFPLHKTRPDADKLLRCALDALTGIAFRDDAQVWDKRCVKYYAGPGETPATFIDIGYYGAEYEADEQPPMLTVEEGRNLR